MSDVSTSRNAWKTVAMAAFTVLGTAATTGYVVGRNNFTREDAAKLQAETKAENQATKTATIAYVDENIKTLRESQTEQKITLANIQGQIGNVRESQGMINGKLDVLIPQLHDLSTRAK